MKKYLLLIIAVMLIAGCAKKTLIADSSRIKKEEQKSSDSIGQRKTDIIDRTVRTVERKADSTVTITGMPLTAIFNPDTTAHYHYENADLDLDLYTNSKTGKTKAIATPKTKKIDFKVDEKTITANNIHTTESAKSKLQTTDDTKSDSSKTHEEKYKDPSAGVDALKTTVIWILAILAVLAAGFYISKKLFKTPL